MVLVTGGTGLVGSHLLVEFVRKGVEVKALKRPDSNIKLVDDLIDFYGVKKMSEIEWVDGDILDYYSLKDALKGVDKVYHAAAMVSLNPKMQQKLREVNEAGTQNMINASIEQGVKKFGYVSSIATLGNSHNGYPVDESCFWQADEKHNEYAVSKFRAEMEVKRASMEGLKTVTVNPSFIIGPGSSNRSSGQVFQKVKSGLPFYTSGSTGYVHAGDVAQAMINLMDSDIENERFILNSENRDLRSFFNSVAESFKLNPPKFKAGNLLLEIAWRMEYIKFKLTGDEPLITKSSAQIAQSKLSYSSKKLIDAIGYKFKALNEAVADTVAFMNRYNH